MVRFIGIHCVFAESRPQVVRAEQCAVVDTCQHNILLPESVCFSENSQAEPQSASFMCLGNRASLNRSYQQLQTVVHQPQRI